MIEDLLVNAIANFSAGVAVTILVGYIIFTNPEATKKWRAMFWWLGSQVWKKAEYWAIKDDIEGRINGFVKSLESKTTTSFPRVKIQLLAKEGEDEGVVWDEDELILVMRDRHHKTKNFVHATYIFTSGTLLNRSKTHLSKKQKKSLDLYATQQILKDTYSGAVEQFMNDYVVPGVRNDDEIRELIRRFEKIQGLGVFFPILIQELSTLGQKVFLERPDQEIIQEVKDLIQFLEDFSQREVGDISVEDTFRGKYTRCTIKIVASQTARKRGDVTPHLSRISGAVHEACENVYVIGSANLRNRMFMNKVCKAVQNKHRELVRKKNHHFAGKIVIHGKKKLVKTYLIHLHNPDVVEYFIGDQ